MDNADASGQDGEQLLGEEPPLPPITTEGVARFYLENQLPTACPTCGDSPMVHVEAPRPDANWTVSSAENSGAIRFPAPALPVVVVACQRCFTLRYHAARPIQTWLRDNPATGELAE